MSCLACIDTSHFPPEFGAGEESRTLDLNLGKVALYQLSYSRENERHYNERQKKAQTQQRDPARQRNAAAPAERPAWLSRVEKVTPTPVHDCP